MKFLITIPASLTHGKKPKIIPAKHFLLEAFSQSQAERRAASFNKFYTQVEPLNDWLEAIPTI